MQRDREVKNRLSIDGVIDRHYQAIVRCWGDVNGIHAVLVGAMHEAVDAALASAPAAEPVRVTDEMVAAYLAANTEYWLEVDSLATGQRNPSKWRNGTPSEATRASLEAALKVAAPVSDPQAQRAQTDDATAKHQQRGAHGFMPGTSVNRCERCGYSFMGSANTEICSKCADAAIERERAEFRSSEQEDRNG